MNHRGIRVVLSIVALLPGVWPNRVVAQASLVEGVVRDTTGTPIASAAVMNLIGPSGWRSLWAGPTRSGSSWCSAAPQ